MAVYYIGCDNSERSFLLSKTKKLNLNFSNNKQYDKTNT